MSGYNFPKIQIALLSIASYQIFNVFDTTLCVTYSTHCILSLVLLDKVIC